MLTVTDGGGLTQSIYIIGCSFSRTHRLLNYDKLHWCRKEMKNEPVQIQYVHIKYMIYALTVNTTQ